MNTAPDHVLIVDDDREIRTLLADYLTKQGLRCTVAANGREMKEVLEHHRIDLIVLDIMMPGEDGLTLCRNLRAGDRHAGVPVLMLTARGDDMDRILGLEMGADDYLAKPFVPRELLARVRAILRRARALPPNMDDTVVPNAREMHFAGWRLDTVARHLIDAKGTTVPLSGAEYRLLGVFLAHPQRVSDPGPADGTHAGARGGRVRPLDRPDGQSAAAASRRQRPRTRHHQDRPQRGLRARQRGRVGPGFRSMIGHGDFADRVRPAPAPT
jgi:two-component system, OmpR family, response regulator